MTQTNEDTAIRQAMLEMAKAEGISEKRFDEVYDALSKGAKIADVLGITKENIEAGYALAYNLYKSGKYKDAETMFRGLCLYDGDDPRLWMGLGACLQARGEYAIAAETYGMAGLAGGMQDPTPFFYGGLCHLKLGNAEDALASFKVAMVLGKDDIPEHKACHDKIQAMLTTLTASKGGTQ